MQVNQCDQRGTQPSLGESADSERLTAVYFGSLLHGVSRLVERGGSTTVANGADIVERLIADGGEGAQLTRQSIMEQVRYCATDGRTSAEDLPGESLAFLTDFASHVASAGANARSENEARGQFGPDANLRKIFNCVNGSSGSDEIPHEPYERILSNVEEGLDRIPLAPEGAEQLIRLLEDATDTVPASVDPEGLIDVSLYDYAKATACFASCALEYCRAQGIADYHRAFSEGQPGFDPYSEPMFLLVSCDLSGIQSFIYSISGTGALRQLRARSLYLEVLLEAIVDELLRRLNLNRANLQYTGGGHCYLLLPNTQRCKEVIERCFEEARAWFSSEFKTDLYLASAWVECSADALMNSGGAQGYSSVYQSAAQKLSAAKACRYSAREIKELNFGASGHQSHERECTECLRSDLAINSEGKCSFCAALGEVSRGLAKKRFFVVLDGNCVDWGQEKRGLLKLPFGQFLDICTNIDESYSDECIVRTYEKNAPNLGPSNGARLWTADYCADMGAEGIAAYAGDSVSLPGGAGIERLGVLRADVDNLGATFVSGLPPEKQSFSRSSVLSRSLSYFFKVKVNDLLQSGGYKAQVIYSGGDDLFLIGNWSDVVYAAIDIRKALRDFVGSDAITISAGIGMYAPKYPIARMASEAGELEDAAKLYSYKGPNGIAEKNAVSLWAPGNVFSWDELVDHVIPLKAELELAFEENEKGKAFIYQLLALLRNYDEVVSAPRLAYLLARSFEDARAEAKKKADDFYRWATDDANRRYFIVALEWFVYSIRERS